MSGSTPSPAAAVAASAREPKSRPDEPPLRCAAFPSRAGVLWIAILGCALVVGGVGMPRPARDGNAAAKATHVALDAAAIAHVFGRTNPSLSAAERARIGEAVMRSSRKYGLSPELVTAVILVESSGRPGARSAKGALGLMQVMPYMLAPLGIAGNPATVESNIEAGCWILAHNIRRLGEDDGISAYFWGSEIRGAFYLDRVRAARARVRRLVSS